MSVEKDSDRKGLGASSADAADRAASLRPQPPKGASSQVASTGAVTVADVLERAADLIEPEGAWCRDPFAIDKDGDEIMLVGSGEGAHYPGAIAFCAGGALTAAAGGYTETRIAARQLLDSMSLGGIVRFNGEHSQAEVVAKLREAAALSRATQQEGGL